MRFSPHSGLGSWWLIALGAAERRRVLVDVEFDLELGAKDWGDLKGHQDFLVLTLTGKRNTAYISRVELRGRRDRPPIPGRAYTPNYLLGTNLPPGNRNKQK